MTAKTKALIAGGIALAVLVTGGIAMAAIGGLPGSSTAAPSASSTPQPSESADPTRSATEIGRAFLDDYVIDSGAAAGRVVRRDQGGDTVSEGQAYGMLVAVALGDEKTFDSIWSWTTTHLQQKDGLMAWRWDDGKIVDDEPASDADMDMTRALLLAGKTFDSTTYTREGKTLGAHVLDDMTAVTPLGRILLPGVWAQGSGPWSYNPSYAAPAAFDELAKSTGDARWSELASGSRKVTTRILESAALPSDWAQVKTDGTVVPLPGPTGDSGTVEYGYDAGRVAIRFAESCTPVDQKIAAKLAAPLSGKDPLPMQLDLGGTPLSQDQSPLGYVARAGALAADGQDGAAQRDLQRADELAQSTPTYYGAAWDALGALQLQTDSLGACAPLKGQ